MRKKISLAVVLIAAVIVTIGGIYYVSSNKSKGTLSPEELTAANLPEKDKQEVFDKEENDSSEVSKFLFKDFDGGCVYSLDQKVFLLTENSEAEKVTCYLACTTEENCKPIAITATGNYMILENERGEKIAVKTQKEQSAEPGKQMAFDKLSQEEQNSLFELIEE